LYYPLFLRYKLLNMFQANMCPSSGADDCVVLSPHVGIGQEGCQNRLAGSVSIEEFVAQLALLEQVRANRASCATNSSMDTLPANRV